jgi:hypothetical protein
MDNCGQHIIDTQNEPLHFQELCAQKQIYTDAKSYFYLQLIVAVPIPILIAVLQLFIDKDNQTFNWIFALYGVTGSISELFIESAITKLKKTAATIQEQFDTAVLLISWNNILIQEKVMPETIHKYYIKHLRTHNDYDRLYNWYSLKIQPVRSNAATLICQRTNCTYDFSIRKKFIYIIGGIAIITLGFILIAANAIGINLPVFFTNIALPVLPVTLIIIKQYKLNNESIQNLIDLKELIEHELFVLNIDTNVSPTIIRQIQDKIFSNRTNSPLMPNRLYNKLWSKLEKEMNFAVETKVAELEV